MGVVSVAKTVVVTKTGVSQTGVAVAETVASVSGVAQTVSSDVVGVSLGIRLSLGLPLGNMDDSGGVGDIAAGSGVTSSDGGDSGTGEAGDAHGGRGGDAGVAGSNNRGGDGVVSQAGVAQTVGTVGTVGSEAIASVASVQEVGVSLSLGVGGRSHAEDSLQGEGE